MGPLRTSVGLFIAIIEYAFPLGRALPLLTYESAINRIARKREDAREKVKHVLLTYRLVQNIFYQYGFANASTSKIRTNSSKIESANKFKICYSKNIAFTWTWNKNVKKRTLMCELSVRKMYWKKYRYKNHQKLF